MNRAGNSKFIMLSVRFFKFRGRPAKLSSFNRTLDMLLRDASSLSGLQACTISDLLNYSMFLPGTESSQLGILYHSSHLESEKSTLYCPDCRAWNFYFSVGSSHFGRLNLVSTATLPSKTSYMLSGIYSGNNALTRVTANTSRWILMSPMEM